MPGRLSLHQEILLLALRHVEGTTEPGSMYSHGMAGGILAELLLRERIGIENDRGKQFIRAVGSRPVGEVVLDQCLRKIVGAKRRATMGTWVGRLATIGGLKHLVARELCRQGVLRADEDKVLLLFPRRTYPEIDPRPERELNARLKRAIFTDAPVVDARTVILISLATGSNLLVKVFPKKRLKDRGERIAAVINGEVTGKATAEAIRAAQTAALVATIIPTIVTTTAHH